MKDTVIFDMDGTIADTLQDLAEAVNHGLKELGFPEHPVEAYKTMVGNGAQKLCFRALPEDKKESADTLYSLFKAYYDRHYLDKTSIYKGIDKVIRNLIDDDFTVAVATNKPQDVARELFAHLMPELAGEVKVLGGCDERAKKPDPAIIYEILGGAPDKECRIFMVGDSNVDIRTAKNSGIISVGCLWGFRSRQELENEGADFIAEAPDDVEDIINMVVYGGFLG